MKIAVFLLLGALAMVNSGCTSCAPDHPEPEAAVFDGSALPAEKSPAYRNRMDGKLLTAARSRQMAYTASFTLTVTDLDSAGKFIRQQAEALGGHAVSVSVHSITLKIPAAKADGFIKAAETAGKVSDLMISAEDLTDTVTDIKIRLDNLQKLRTRLASLLSQAARVDEILKVERELNRVTSEIERLTAQQQRNAGKVAMTTVTVSLQTIFPADRSSDGALRYYPFLKDQLFSTAGGSEISPLWGTELPENFITAPGPRAGTYAAVTADDCLLTMQECRIPENSTLEFWEKMVKRSLEKYHDFTVRESKKTQLDALPAILLCGEKKSVTGKIKIAVIIALEQNIFCADRLRIVEFSGDGTAFDRHFARLLQKVQ